MNIFDFIRDNPEHAKNVCILCQKPITATMTCSMVEIDTDGEILDPTAPDYDSNNPDSQGGFHIGSGCKKRLIKAGANPKWFQEA